MSNDAILGTGQPWYACTTHTVLVKSIFTYLNSLIDRAIKTVNTWYLANFPQFLLEAPDVTSQFDIIVHRIMITRPFVYTVEKDTEAVHQ